MKKAKILAVILAIVVTCGVFFAACNTHEPEYTITLNPNKSSTLKVGDEVDFTQYFIVTDRDGNQITVTKDMLDLSQVDLSKPGIFAVTLTIGEMKKSMTFIVEENQGGSNTGGNNGDNNDDNTKPADIVAILAKYEDVSKWNFAVTLKETSAEETFNDYYEYLGYDVLNYYEYDGYYYSDYLGYDVDSDTYYFYGDYGDGTYELYEEGSEEFDEYASYMYLIYPDELCNFYFTADGNDKFVANAPDAVGDAVICDYGDEYPWTGFTVYVANDRISKIVAEIDSYDYKVEFTFTKYGAINFVLPNVSGGDNGENTGGSTGIDALDEVVLKYVDMSKWNFAVTLTFTYDGETDTEYYEYLGYSVLNTYSSDGETYTDYIGCDEDGIYYYYSDNGDGTYDIYDENSDEFFYLYFYLYLVYPDELCNHAFTADGTDKYVANNPDATGDAVIADYGDGNEWTSFTVYVADGKISKIVGMMADGYTEEYTFSKHGQINFTLPDGTSSGGGSDNPTTPPGVMEKQTHDVATFDRESLQDKMLQVDGAIGLPSTGDINALVIPVQFVGDTITPTQLADLQKAFNGNGTNTGWESVSSYYYKSSYGALNLTFDIQDVYEANYNASYYESYNEKYWMDGDQYTRTGEEIILTEALAYYENLLDLTKYDTNDDGCIDAVYLIYSASVDYNNADFYWAYVTWYYGENQYDGLDAYYYLFAGIDFMYESTAQDDFSGAGKIDGLTVNASTYIHETGHLLGLDDYYDYDEKAGGNEGLGGADMMDYTVGDHNVYSKIMLGWLTPTIVTDTQTLTIESSQASASAILIPLNFNNSYFCEYLLIDLYSAQGLNALHASAKNSLLYDGEEYGVRIYHVSSSINNPYDNDYGSFTDYNNTDTKIALIKLVEADGDKKFSSSDGYAAYTDLWQAGQTLSKVFPTYARNDGKTLNFDVTVVSVSATSATITITYND